MLKNAIFLLFSLTLFQSMGQSDDQIISVQTKDNNTYKYYQIEVKTGTNLIGKVMLNGFEVHEFNKEMSRSSRNLKRKRLKNGKNKLVLKISNVSGEIEKGYFDKAAITMIFHATNEPAIPSEETQLFKILWDPKPGQTETVVEYNFELNL